MAWRHRGWLEDLISDRTPEDHLVNSFPRCALNVLCVNVREYFFFKCLLIHFQYTYLGISQG